ncbi:hypothetical protein Tco_0945839 [Tanacetum coccineum]
MVYQLTKFHVQRVDMVINPPWNLPFLGAKGLTSPEQTATGKGISNPLMAVMVCQKPYGLTTPELMANWFQPPVAMFQSDFSSYLCDAVAVISLWLLSRLRKVRWIKCNKLRNGDYGLVMESMDWKRCLLNNTDFLNVDVSMGAETVESDGIENQVSDVDIPTSNERFRTPNNASIMNVEKLHKMASVVCTGRKGSMRSWQQAEMEIQYLVL